MSQDYKGIPQLYDEILALFSDNPKEKISFYEWIKGSSGECVEGQVAYCVVSFFKRKKWVLKEHQYNPTDEEKSTWYAEQLSARLPEEDSGYVKKYFDLEKGESLITNNCKVRPVILIKRNENDWWNPSSTAGLVESWTCLPLFSYKERHIQNFVIDDQKLKSNRFYIPVAHTNQPGINMESAAIFESIQTIQSGNIRPCKSFCDADKMSHQFRLSSMALKLVMYHHLVQTNSFKCFDAIQTEYELFKSMVNDYFLGIGM